jgi:hypothetical protein
MNENVLMKLIRHTHAHAYNESKVFSGWTTISYAVIALPWFVSGKHETYDPTFLIADWNQSPSVVQQLRQWVNGLQVSTPVPSIRRPRRTHFTALVLINHIRKTQHLPQPSGLTPATDAWNFTSTLTRRGHRCHVTSISTISRRCPHVRHGTMCNVYTTCCTFVQTAGGKPNQDSAGRYLWRRHATSSRRFVRISNCTWFRVDFWIARNSWFEHRLQQETVWWDKLQQNNALLFEIYFTKVKVKEA